MAWRFAVEKRRPCLPPSVRQQVHAAGRVEDAGLLLQRQRLSSGVLQQDRELAQLRIEVRRDRDLAQRREVPGEYTSLTIATSITFVATEYVVESGGMGAPSKRANWMRGEADSS